MKPARLAAVLLLLLAAAAPEGDWLTENREGVIRIAPCPGGLCGRIIGMLEPGLDVQGRTECGLEIIHRLTRDGAGMWQGRITDPETGRGYYAQVTPQQDGTLRLWGALDVPLLRDILGQTQLWTPFSGNIGAGCQMEKQPPR